MRIGLFHGYELTGSRSNECNRYLSRTLARAGHQVRLFCREPNPEAIGHVGRAYAPDGSLVLDREVADACELHQLPHSPVRPVYLCEQ